MKRVFHPYWSADLSVGLMILAACLGWFAFVYHATGFGYMPRTLMLGLLGLVCTFYRYRVVLDGPRRTVCLEGRLAGLPLWRRSFPFSQVRGLSWRGKADSPSRWWFSLRPTGAELVLWVANLEVLVRRARQADPALAEELKALLGLR